MKKTITITTFSSYELEGDIKDTIKTLESYYNENKDKYEKIYINVSFGLKYGTDEYCDIEIVGEREENLSEKTNREIKEARELKSNIFYKQNELKRIQDELKKLEENI